ncbi:MAG: ABC transporter permease [Candidatus Absconditabacteria bacterium]|nr:ABC transporter permease [Candidatus Absconditabacteria bacterium]MDD3868730.1 ABC transporter permease [Candidatus Absconditabacteria bacterium]MDD4714771.1 ABC transporter permease [Candidatus Absconditabacteria bacterium]
MLGIVIGLSSVVILMAVGSGAQQGIMDQMSSLINNNITLSSQGGYTVWTDEEINGYVKAIEMTPELTEEIEAYFPQLSGSVTYGATTMGQIANEDQTSSTMGIFGGVPIDYIDKMQQSLSYGSNFYQSDYDTVQDVAIVNKNVVESLFNGAYAVGQKIVVSGREYTIIGVLDESSIMGQVTIPITTYQQRVSGNTNIDGITIKLSAEEDSDLWMQRIKYFLLRKYNIKHIDLAGFSLSSTAAIGDAIDSSMAIFNILLAAIGSISLLVGGIGVMNIMLVSVTERTREIGIRKAIGALNADIIQQFLIESVVITLIGGIIALLFSWVAVKGIASLGIEGLVPQITLSVVITATVLTFVIGILSGILPAKRAANLKPIDALRFE